MTKNNWSADGQDIPIIEPHTKAKHRIIEGYIKNMIITLYKTGKYGVTKFTLIDGFCGGGIYDDQDNNQKWYGSPTRIINAVREGYQESKRKYDLNVKYIFIDENPEHLSCLKNYAMQEGGLSELASAGKYTHKTDWESQLIEECEFIEGTFESNINYCILDVEKRKGHSFFFLDPYGWTDVSMESIRKINSLKGSEILFNYMINSIKRFIKERDKKQKNGFQNILESDGYYKSAELQKIDKIDQQCYLRNESLRLFRDKGKARYMVTFSMIPKGNALVLYYLIHFSQNVTAIEVMKDTFFKQSNLDFQYHLELYGFGFKTAEFYEENMTKLEFNTTKDKDSVCIEKLDMKARDELMKNDNGILYQELINQTMEITPAIQKHYKSYINSLIKDKEIEVFRNGKKQKQKNISLQKDDIIKKTDVKYYPLF